MKKRDLIDREINKLEKEIDRLSLLSYSVSGDTLEICPKCKTKNRHWSTKGGWCCAFC